MTETTTLTTTSNSVFSGIQAFEDAQRIAKALASSTLIPPQFQGQQGFANCLVALEIANRMGISPFLCMQHLHIIHGRPSWSSAFIIAMVNGCGRFTPLRFEISGSGDSLACYAVATDIKTNQELEGANHHNGNGQKRRLGNQGWQQMVDYARADDQVQVRGLLGASLCW
jgi:hypothetical protein